MSSLGLNEHHYKAIVNFMRFSRYRRGQHLRAVDGSVDDLKASRLIDQMYTTEEVTELLDSLHDLLKAELESELINATHTNTLLLQQMFEQAEKWHLKLQVDVSQLENKELLDKIKEFEDKELNEDGKHTSPVKLKLEPISQTEGPVVLLNMEIDKLKEENNKLKQRLLEVESQASKFLHEKKRISQDLSDAKSQLQATQSSAECRQSSEQISSIEQEVSKVREEMEETLKFSGENQKCLEGDLTSTKHQLLEIKAQLELAEKELERKFSQTATYNNMKKMLLKKNEQIKEMRKRLSEYEVVLPDDS